MNRVMVFGVVFGTFAAASSVHAQYMLPQMGGYGSQLNTPYVNLLQRNVNPAITYQGIVQPQLQTQANFQQLQNQINLTRTMSGGVAPPRNTGVSDTGSTPARFMQYQQYFNTFLGQQRLNNQTRSTGINTAYGGR